MPLYAREVDIKGRRRAINARGIDTNGRRRGFDPRSNPLLHTYKDILKTSIPLLRPSEGILRTIGDILRTAKTIPLCYTTASPAPEAVHRATKHLPAKAVAQAPDCSLISCRNSPPHREWI